MPGLRLGLLVAPAPLNHGIGAAKQFSDISSSGLLQRTLDLYLREETWQQHMLLMKKIYTSRYEATKKGIMEYLPKEIHFVPPGGGFHLWLQLPQGITGDELYRQCMKEDVLITPGSYFAPTGLYNQWFRLSYAAVTVEDINQGIKTMGKVIRNIQVPHTVQPLL